MTRFVYSHPVGKGFGEHHVEEGRSRLEDRSAVWQGFNAQDYEPHAGEISMKDLDMPSGTEVDLLEDDEERDLRRVGWTDSQGTERITSVDPTLFAEYFMEVDE